MNRPLYNPPTPAFAKAGAAPGTTVGVELLQGSVAASTTQSGHSPLLLRAFKPAVCQASNPYTRACQAPPLFTHDFLRCSQYWTYPSNLAVCTGSMVALAGCRWRCGVRLRSIAKERFAYRLNMFEQDAAGRVT